MKFFFDNNISPRIARALRELVEGEHEVCHLRDRFKPNSPDPEWISQLGREGGWILITGDLRIRRRTAERLALNQARLTSFFMAKGFAPTPNERAGNSDWFWEQVKWIVQKWPLIVEQARRVEPGAEFIVPKKGNRLKQP